MQATLSNVPREVTAFLQTEHRELIESAPPDVKALFERAKTDPQNLFATFGTEDAILVQRDEPGSNTGTVIARIPWQGGAILCFQSLAAWAEFSAPRA